MADMKQGKSKRDAPTMDTSSEDTSDENSEKNSSDDSSSSSSSPNTSIKHHEHEGKKSRDIATSDKSYKMKSKEKSKEKEMKGKTYEHTKRKTTLIDEDNQKKRRREEYSHSDKERKLSENKDRDYDKGAKKHSRQSEDNIEHKGKRQLSHHGSLKSQDRERYEHDRRGPHSNYDKYENRHSDKYSPKERASKREHSRGDVGKSRHKNHHDNSEYFDRRHRREEYQADTKRSRHKGSHRENHRSESEERRSRHVREWDRGKSNDGYDEEERRQRKESEGNKNTNNASEQQKEEPNFELSGKLTEFTNTYKGFVIKYNEPPEARKPKTKWRIYPFKGDDSLPVLYIHRQSAYLLGRNRMIADIPIDHPSCSSQHAVIQYRFVDYEKADGTMGKRVRPYVIDLESSNGTFVNNNKIEPRRYVELKEKDVLKFGFSSREYVLLHDQSQGNLPDEAEKN